MDKISEHFDKTIAHLKEELGQIRTGRATPMLVENITVQAYDSTSSIRELASISVPEPQSLMIQPWDVSILKDIEKAIQQSSLELQPINDGRVIRLVLPPLTEERRNDLVKLVKEKSEKAKISIRSVREKEMKSIKSQQTDGTISEDQSKQQQKELQASVDEAMKQIDEYAVAKESELTTTS